MYDIIRTSLSITLLLMRRDQDVKQVEETRGLVLQSAQREFLDKGYEKASLRSIAQNAGVTTGALYVRFPNKSALFAALVEPYPRTCSGSSARATTRVRAAGRRRPEDMWSTSEDVITRIVDYIFEHKEPFDLLINHAAGSGYEHFLDDLVEEEVSQSLAYLDAMRERGLACATVPRRPPCARERGILRILRNRSPRHLERGRRCAHQTHRRLLPPRLGEPLRRVMPSFHDH